MNRTSGVSDLQARLQKTAETERQEVEAIVQSEIKKLSKNLRGIVAHELYTIESDTKVWSRRLSAAALKAWARPIVIGLLIFLGICVGSWGLTQWYAIQIQNLIERRDVLTVQYNESLDAMRLQSERQQTLLDQTWGVWLHEAEDGTRYVVLPDGTTIDSINRWPHTVQGQPAVRLSSE